MRIEDENSQSKDRAELIRELQKQAEQQQELQAQAQQKVEDQQQIEVGDASVDVEQAAEAKAELAQDQQRLEEPQQLDGSGLSEQAIEKAHLQEEAGDDWTQFSDKTKNEIPDAVQAAQADEQAKEEQQKVAMKDLIAQMQIQSGKIDA